MTIKKTHTEIEKSKQILNCLLPAFVRRRVKDGSRYIADDQGIATVLFCDIYNFEDIVELYPLDELTAFLDDVYRQFDRICELVGVTKVETVGKTYMACAGVKDIETEMDPQFKTISHTRRAIEMGIATLKASSKIKLINGENLKVKIGIHTGPITAGVVGYHKPQFSLVGDTINTASRMASTISDPNVMQISEETFRLLDDKNGLIFVSKTIQAKGKGLMTTYHVKEREINDEILQVYEHDKNPSILSSPSNYPLLLSANNETRHPSDSRRITMLENLDLYDHSALLRHLNSKRKSSKILFSLSCKETHSEKLMIGSIVNNGWKTTHLKVLSLTISNLLLGIIELVHL